MSHSISAYTSVAELDTSRTETAHALYKALGAEDYDNGCSGSGEEQSFSRDEIKAAIKKLPFEAVRARNFLLDCLDYDEVLIRFH